MPKVPITLTASSAFPGLLHTGKGEMALVTRVCKKLQEDSPLALFPLNVLSALAFSRGPTTHGGERSANVTLTP